MGFCHCESCRHWSAGPVNAFVLWKPDALRITKGADNIGTYTKNPSSNRRACAACGGHYLQRAPGLGLTDVYSAVVPGLEFKPGVHVNYQESVLRIKDGLPKLKDFPRSSAVPGQMLAE